MAEYTLTLLDTTGIQGYIFGSNTLRENIGASELVHRATRVWPFELVQKAGQTNITTKTPQGDLSELDDSRSIEDGSLAAEVVYAGGGNCVILFADPVKARAFVTELSRRLLVEAPDLGFVVAHVPLTWSGDAGDSLAEKVNEGLKQLEAKKLAGHVSTPLLGVSTTVACQSTGLPAVGTDADEPGLKPPKEKRVRPLSAGILAKLRTAKGANLRLERLCPQLKDARFTIPYDLDNFGRTRGEVSYIAVVHVDGNRIGQRVERLSQDFSHAKQNRAYIQAMRDFSRTVEKASRDALCHLTDQLLRRCTPQFDAIKWQTRRRGNATVELEDKQVVFAKDEEHHYIPFRPIVFGGDDITFVTDGRLGLTLAAAYLAEFETAMAATKNPYARNITACAGVAVVKVHYPFSRAYALADNLCQNAKEAYQRECSALDWHFAATGLFGNIETIRKRQYVAPDGSLVMRPVRLKPQPPDWRSWLDFADIVESFLVDDEWRQRRNKVIALREALRQGSKEVERFRLAYNRSDPLPAFVSQPSQQATLQTTGWDGSGRCGYFDAIEALDFYLPLQDGIGGQT